MMDLMPSDFAAVNCTAPQMIRSEERRVNESDISVESLGEMP